MNYRLTGTADHCGQANGRTYYIAAPAPFLTGWTVSHRPADVDGGAWQNAGTKFDTAEDAMAWAEAHAASN